MKIRDYITLYEVSDGEVGPSYRNRGTWIYNEDPDYYEWGAQGQEFVDTVGYAGSLYSAKQSGGAQTPPCKAPITNAYWDILIAKGYIDSDLDWYYDNADSFDGSSLIKVSGTDGVEDATAHSKDKYKNNCFVSFNIADTTSSVKVGLGKDKSIMYGFSFKLGQVYIIENTTQNTDFLKITYKAGDLFAIDYSDDEVSYYFNGDLAYQIQDIKINDSLGFSAIIASITSLPVITQIRLSTFEPYIDWVRDWDGTKTQIGSTYIVSPKAFLGVNNGSSDEPELTGVAIGIDISGAFSSEIGLAGYNINQQTFIIRADGSATFGVDAEKSSQFSIKPDGSASIKNLNADTITTGTLLGSMLDAKGIVVRDETEKESFIISSTGDVELKGEIKSMNYIDDDKTGYALLRDGTAILNEAVVRGSVSLPNAGMTNEGQEQSSIRIWAGAEYEDRDKASFRISQAGDLYAKKGTFGGVVAADEVHTGTSHLTDGSFVINNIYTALDDSGTTTINSKVDKEEKTYIKLDSSGSIINSDLLIGSAEDKRIEFIKNTKSLGIQNTTIAINGNKMGIRIDKDGPVSITSFLEGHNSNTTIGYSTSDNWINTLIIENKGNKSTSEYGDICIKRESSRDNIDVGVLGNVTIQGSLSSFEHSVEMRSVPNEGWGFYIV